MKRVGIMGGTFNPIHYAHLTLAENALDQFHLDEIMFLPSKRPAHKSMEDLASDEHRFCMVQKAITGNPNFYISALEFEREGNTYTVDTLERLKRDHKEYEYYFILGGDSLFQFETWKEPERILSLCHIIASIRGEYPLEALKRKVNELKIKYNADIEIVTILAMDISSRMIRERVRKNQTIQYLLPDSVIAYIKEHNLYKFDTVISDKNKVQTFNNLTFHDNQTEGIYNFNQLIQEISESLPRKRYLHSLSVGYLSASLAMRYGEDVNAAMIAGLLHDCAKSLKDNEILRQCDELKIPVTEIERRNAHLLHGKLGAYYAEHKFNIKSPDILSAIIYHTTGRPRMSMLEKIIFLADYIEIGRTWASNPSLDTIRMLAFDDIDMAIYHVLVNVINYLQNKDEEIDETTIRTKEYYQTII